jgi:hypothetical protein
MTLLYWARYGFLVIYLAVIAYLVYAHLSTGRGSR